MEIFFYAPDDYPEFGMQRRGEWKPIENTDLIPGIVLTYSRKDGTIRFIENNALQTEEKIVINIVTHPAKLVYIWILGILGIWLF